MYNTLSEALIFMCKSISITLFIIQISHHALADQDILKVNLKIKENFKSEALYITHKKQKIKSMSVLSQAKYYEIQGEWDSCLINSEKAFLQEELLKDVISSLWLKCFLKSGQIKKLPSIKIISSIERLLQNDKSDFYGKISQLADSKDKKMKEYFSLLAESFRKLSAAKQSRHSPTGNDLDLEKKIHVELNTKNFSSATRLIVELMNLYPGSPLAEKWKDKPLELYVQTSSTGLLHEMGEAHHARIQKWASQLHNRLDYPASLKLAERAIQKSASSPSLTQLLWIAGRSALFVGEYDKALRHFKQLVDFHYGTDESHEAAFRSGLIYYRRGEFLEAKKNFQSVLDDVQDRYELNALYWLYRSSVKMNSEDATSLREKLISEYPYSYYGLKVSAETHNGVLRWNEPKEILNKKSSLIWLAGPSKTKWLRFKKLATAGLIQEAKEEFEAIDFVLSAEQKWHMADMLSKYGIYLPAFRLFNQAIDEEKNLRNKDFLAIIYPDVYREIYKKESQKYNIDATLLKSLTRQESAFYPQAVSSSNALGLMQMIPPTAEEVAKALNINSIRIPEDLFLPEKNIPMGTYYISEMIKQFNGVVPQALAAYNAGPHRLKQWLKHRNDTEFDFNDDVWIDELPWYETSFYVKAILRNTIIYKLLEDGKFAYKPAFWQDYLLKNSTQ